MIPTLPFSEHVAEYEQWYEVHPFVFRSEVQAIKELIPPGQDLKGLEVAAATGRLSEALGIFEAIEPCANMRSVAQRRGVNVRSGEAEFLPYHAMSFDFVVMSFCISYFESIRLAFKEANRVLKPNGCLIVGFLDKDSIIGKEYEGRRDKSVFYKQATFYSPDKVLKELKEAGFKEFTITQTLYGSLDEIKEVQYPEPGYGKGSYVLVKAIKK